MDGQLLELWGRWFTTALQGQSQMDTLGGWWIKNLQYMSSVNKPYPMMWTMPSTCNHTGPNLLDGFEQMWEQLLKMQQQSMQWAGMVPRDRYEALVERVEELEATIEQQARTIERLQHLLGLTGGKNNVLVTQLHDLIGQQSQQFKQLTQSVGDYIKGGTEKSSAKK